MKWSATLTLRNSGFVQNHSSSPSWPALTQGFRRAKKPGRWPRGSTDEARSSPGSDHGNTTGPDTHWHARFWLGSGNAANAEVKSPLFMQRFIQYRLCQSSFTVLNRKNKTLMHVKYDSSFSENRLVVWYLTSCIEHFEYNWQQLYMHLE